MRLIRQTDDPTHLAQPKGPWIPEEKRISKNPGLFLSLKLSNYSVKDELEPNTQLLKLQIWSKVKCWNSRALD
jgi:hypothetical protein